MVCNSNNIPYILSVGEEYLVIRVLLQPNAKKNEVIGIHGDALRIRITAHAIENKANQALLLYLAEVFHVKKSHVILAHGQRNRIKYISIHGDVSVLLAQCKRLCSLHD